MKKYLLWFIYIMIYTVAIITLILFVIRNDVSYQLNKAYELNHQHDDELQQCHQQLGDLYETN